MRAAGQLRKTPAASLKGHLDTFYTDGSDLGSVAPAIMEFSGSE